jgi:hypothetical protein
MYSKVNAAQVFRKFAQDKLKGYTNEFKAKYESKNLHFTTKELAPYFYERLHLYRTELEEQKNRLLKEQPLLKNQLDKIYQDYLHKFEMEFGPR